MSNIAERVDCERKQETLPGLGGLGSKSGVGLCAAYVGGLESFGPLQQVEFDSLAFI